MRHFLSLGSPIILGLTTTTPMHSASRCDVGTAAGLAGLGYPADCLCSALHLSRGQRRAGPATRGEHCGLESTSKIHSSSSYGAAQGVLTA